MHGKNLSLDHLCNCILNSSESKPDNFFILPIVIGVATYLGQKMSTVDQNQQKILMFMPFLMVIISFKMPAGVLLYWAISQVISSGQQILIMKQGKESK